MNNHFLKIITNHALIAGFAGLVGSAQAAVGLLSPQTVVKSANVQTAGKIIGTPQTTALSTDRTGWKWNPGYYFGASAAIVYNGQTISDVKRDSYQPIITARNKLFADLRSEIDLQTSTELRKSSDYRWHTVSITGPLDLSITPGSPVPGPVVALTGPVVVVTVKLAGVQSVVEWECTATINSGAMNLSGNLDVVQGTLSNLRMNGFSPSFSRSCSTNLSWIPFVGDFVDSYVNKFADEKLRTSIAAGVTKTQGTFKPINFAGLNSAIPAGVYMFSGTDAGQYVTNNLAYLIAQTNVLVRFNQPLPTLIIQPNPFVSPVSGDEDIGKTYDQKDEAFSISFTYPGNNLRLVAYSQTRFTSYFICYFC